MAPRRAGLRARTPAADPLACCCDARSARLPRRVPACAARVDRRRFLAARAPAAARHGARHDGVRRPRRRGRSARAGRTLPESPPGKRRRRRTGPGGRAPLRGRGLHDRSAPLRRRDDRRRAPARDGRRRAHRPLGPSHRRPRPSRRARRPGPGRAVRDRRAARARADLRGPQAVQDARAGLDQRRERGLRGRRGLRDARRGPGRRGAGARRRGRPGRATAVRRPLVERGRDRPAAAAPDGRARPADRARPGPGRGDGRRADRAAGIPADPRGAGTTRGPRAAGGARAAERRTRSGP